VTVHGLWPETGSYGTSKCVAPSVSKADPTKVYSCYKTGESTAGQLSFETHEWEKHGWCAGVKDVDDFFNQICGLAAKPTVAMAAVKTLDEMKKAVVSAGYEVFSVDTANDQLQLSACLDSASGQWKLAAGGFPRSRLFAVLLPRCTSFPFSTLTNTVCPVFRIQSAL
jgi:hypothetical protein